ncbi:MAG TPA: hypothetical protein VNX22_10020 [Acidobacteriaceae bacterium]|nr:hypothetical protein [Acidobacteriaceae bacterium]
MSSDRELRQAKRRKIGALSVFALLVLVAAPGFGQVPDPIYSDPTDPGYTGPAPVTRDTVTTPNLGNVNENADTTQYVDREAGPFNLGIDLKSGYGDNLFNTPGSTQSGYYTGFGVPVGLRLRSKQTLFNANYRIDQIYYPQFSDVANTSQSLTGQLEHHASEHTSYFWNLSGGRINNFGQYLPAFIQIGNTGVAQGSVRTSGLENGYTTSNAASSLGFTHGLSERNQVFGTVTIGWVEQAQGKADPGQPRQLIRSEVAGLDLRYDHATGPRSSIGAEVTNVYIRGLAPRGHDNYTTLSAIYRRTLTAHLDFHASAGPLFSVASGGGVGSQQNFTYAASANMDYSIAHTRIGVGYNRVLQLDYIQSAVTANQFSGMFDRELSPTIDLTIDGRYVLSDSSSALLRQSQFGVDGRINKRIAANILLFVSATRSQQTAPSALGNTNSFSRDDVSAGITVLFGNPIYSRGVH